jgi:ATP-dependent protease ClpP protease subunit
MKNKKKTWYNAIYNAEKSVNELFIYDQIGYWGISASQFAMDLRALDSNKRLSVRINSPGGDVFDGLAIYSLLRDYKGGVDIIVDGLAASIASVIAMAGDTLSMYDTAMLMIHKPWTVTMGDSTALRNDADLLDKIQNQIKLTYSKKMALTDEELDAVIDGTTWIEAGKAEEYGLDIKIIGQSDEEKTKNSIENKILSFKSHEAFEKFDHIPQRIAACLVGKVKNEEVVEPPKEEPIVETPIEPNQEPITEPIKEPLTKDDEMTPEEKEAHDKLVAANAVKAEKERQAGIRACGKKLNISNEEIESAVEKELSVFDASKLFIDKFAAQTTPVPQVGITADEKEKFVDLHTYSLSHAAGLLKDKAEIQKGIEARKNGGATSLHGTFRSYLASKGVKDIHNLDGHALIQKVHNEMVAVGTGDLPSVFENTINKALDTTMQAVKATFPIWTSTKAVKDFRQFSLAKLSSVSDVKEIKENQDFTIGSISDKKEVGTLKTKGIFMSLSREAQINDDLGALTDMGAALGRSIMNGQERDCYDYLFGTAFAGPTLTEDNAVMFSTGRGNLLTSGGAAPSSTTIDAGVLAMMTRTKLKGNPADKNEYTGIMPRFLIVPPKHKGAAERTVYSPSYPDATYSSGVYNAYAASGSTPLVVVTVPYLGALDADGWYLAADSMDIPTIVRLTLNGNESPFIEQDIARGKDPLGINFRCYYDWAFMAGDWRGMYCNDGDA